MARRRVCRQDQRPQTDLLSIADNAFDAKRCKGGMEASLRVLGRDDAALQHALGRCARDDFSAGQALQISQPADMVQMLMARRDEAHIAQSEPQALDIGGDCGSGFGGGAVDEDMAVGGRDE